MGRLIPAPPSHLRSPPRLTPLLVAAAFSMQARAEVTPGEILMSEMNCVACHAAPPALEARLASRQAPRLGTAGLSLTPQWLRDFLADPAKAKPGTLMPDLLHALPPDQKTASVEALVHYLVSIQPPFAAPNVTAKSSVIAAGERLYHQVGCVQCHAPTQLPEARGDDPAAKEDLARVQATSVPLGGNLAQKYTVPELARFLQDPLKIRPSGRMPSLGLDKQEAEAIAMALLQQQIPEGKPRTAAGLRYSEFKADFDELPDVSRLTPQKSGIAPIPSTDPTNLSGSFALHFEGNIAIAEAGRYTFFLESDDGARLSIDDRLVVDNSGRHTVQERSNEVDLSAGIHRFALTYFQADGDSALNVRWKGPRIPRQIIPRSAFSHDDQPLVPLGTVPFTLDPALVARGRTLFGELNCAACHRLDTPGRPSKPLPQLVGRQPKGCLSAKPGAAVPKFEMNDRQRQVILALLQEQAPLNTPLSDEEQIRRTMTVLNCYACHARDRRGGADAFRRDYFSSTGQLDLGDEGRIPPNLNKVGSKLQASWLQQTLTNGTKARPYMATRMPQFGAANVAALPELFVRADTPAAPTNPAPPRTSDTDSAKFGRKLVGTGGLGCVTCHSFDKFGALGIPAVELTATPKRIQWEWFRSYLLNPAAVRPGTRMPSFWPGGVAANQDILGGDAEKQIAAIWEYLSHFKDTPPPDGVLQGKQEIIATNEAVIYRNFIEGGGSRAIGVGYPEKVNLCFDANDLRLALIWRGAFIDSARHRTGRGVGTDRTGRGIGFEKPLGTDIIKRAPGPSFAQLPSESAPWPLVEDHRRSNHFRGYRLDEKRRPTFRYQIGEIEVEDTSLPAIKGLESGFHRTFALTSPQAPVNWFYRAAIANRIDAREDGQFVIDERYRLRFPQAKAQVREIDGRQELIVPITFTDGSATLIEELNW